MADLMTGMYASVAILASLMRRDRGGGGEYIDMALLDCQVAMLSNQAQNYLISDSIPKRYGNAHPNVVPYQSFKTSDGHVILAIGNDNQFGKFCRAAGVPELAAAPPLLGEHTDHILSSVLGLSEDEIRNMHDKGVI